MTDYVAHALAVYKKTEKKLREWAATPKYRSLAYTAALAASVLLLLATSVYAGYKANFAYSTDSNSIIAGQQFGTGVDFPATVPGPHPLILKIPMFLVQGHLPYNYTNLTIGNVSLVVITMLAWALLLIKLFGRKYEIPILIFLSSLILTSVIFSLSLGYTSIRNIEYPIVLWFVMIVSDVLWRRQYSRRQLALAITGSVLFSITLASDSLFTYATVLPLLVVIAWYWVQSRQFTVQMLKAAALVVGTVIGAALLKFILSAADILIFNYAYWSDTTVIPTISLSPSLTFALDQLLDLQGGNIFGQVINSSNMAVFVNFGLFVFGLLALILILVKTHVAYRKKAKFEDNNFVFATMAISYFALFFVYVLSGLVVATSPDGKITSVENTRYISFLPLISSIGFFWLIKNYYDKHKELLVALCAVLVLCITVGFSGVRAAYGSGIQLELAPSRASIMEIIHIMESNNVDRAFADYWYGVPLAFWSKNAFGLEPQQGCAVPPAQDSPEAAFTRKRGEDTVAIVIDRGGLNYAFWTCTDEQIETAYGTPTKKYEVPGVTPTPVQVWVYKGE